MKKVKVFVFAVAAMSMAMTSCNKEEAVDHSVIEFSVENNEIFNEAKTHLNGTDLLWDDGDVFALWDGSGRGSRWKVRSTDGNANTLEFVQNTNNAQPFDENDGDLYAVYPTSISEGRHSVVLPYEQLSAQGELKNFPMYAEGPAYGLHFLNLCGVVRLKLTGNLAIDSIAITTEQRISGRFIVDFSDVTIANTHPLTVQDGASYGTNTVMAKYPAGGLTLSSSVKEANIYIPAGTYSVFNITFYANGKYYTMRNVDPITIMRTQFKSITKTLDASKFEDCYYGTTNAQFVLGSSMCYIAKGNLTYIGKNFGYWRVADNGFDGLSDYQARVFSGIEDRDLFGWGANYYYYQGTSTPRGNGVGLATRNGYKTGVNSLTGNNTWAWNNIRNINRTDLTWRTPSHQDAVAILNGNTHFTTKLTFVGAEGIEGTVIRPANCNLGALANMTKEQWNVYEEAGCAFFPNTYHRLYGGNAGEGSIYWTSDAADDDKAYTFFGTTARKGCGASVRLIAIAE